MARRAVAILKATDVEATCAWYRKAGFDVDHPGHGGTWCEVARDGLVVQFISGDTPWAGAPALTGCFYVHVDDVDAVASHVRGNGIQPEWGVEDRPWGTRELVLQDPDGYYVTFTADLPHVMTASPSG